MLRKNSTLSSLFGNLQPSLPQINDTLASGNSNSKLWGRSRKESAAGGGGAGKAELISGWNDSSMATGQVKGPTTSTYHSSVATSARRVIHGRTDWSAK